MVESNFIKQIPITHDRIISFDLLLPDEKQNFTQLHICNVLEPQILITAVKYNCSGVSFIDTADIRSPLPPHNGQCNTINGGHPCHRQITRTINQTDAVSTAGNLHLVKYGIDRISIIMRPTRKLYDASF